MVNAALEREPDSLTQSEHSSRQMGHYQRIRADCWAGESSDIRDEVLKIYDAEHNGDEEEEEENEDDETGEDDDEKTLLVRQQG